MRPTKVLLIGTAAAFLFASSHSVLSKPAKTPQHLRLSLAGFRVGQIKRLYDPKEKYFLVGTGDCDGAHMALALLPEGEDKERDAEWKKYPRVSLPRLRTGKGVNIGDTPAQVQQKLGKAPDFYSYDRTFKRRAYVYRATLFQKNGAGKTEKIFYSGEYTFRNERLWSISYSLNEADGCG